MKAALALIAAALANVADSGEQAVRFVSCPVYRDADAGRKSGCWLSDDPTDGRRYDVSLAPTKPDWNFAVLVEGKPAQVGEGACGGAVLDPVRVSVLDRPCTRFMLEAEGYPGRKFVLPKRNVHPLYETRTPLARPFVARGFSIPFDFDSSFISYQLADYYLDAAITYALDVAPARITIAGSADTRGARVSGIVMHEQATLKDTRAQLVRRALVLRGIAPSAIAIVPARVRAESAEPFDGLAEPTARRVDIVVTPLAGNDAARR